MGKKGVFGKDAIALNEELEESLDEIDEILTEKESSVTTAFSWSNVSLHNRGGATKRPKIDNTLVVIDSP